MVAVVDMNDQSTDVPPGAQLLGREWLGFDGEITSFSRLQGRMQNARPNAAQVATVPVYFYLFDLIWFDAHDLSALPLIARKAVLRKAVAFADPIRFSEHLDEENSQLAEGP